MHVICQILNLAITRIILRFNERDFSFVGNTIWLKAQQEAFKTFGTYLQKPDLQILETGIRMLSRHYETCEEMALTTRRAYCFYQFVEKLGSVKRDLKWEIGPETKEGRAKFGFMFYTLMGITSHIVIIALENFKLFKDDALTVKAKAEFYALVQNEIDIIFEQEDALVTWRLDQITPVTICEVKLVFWKEFEQTCETRWRRSIEEDDEVASGNDLINHKKICEDCEDDNFISLDKVDRIGGLTDKRNMLFQASVIDHVTNRVIFKQESEGRGSERGNVLHHLFLAGMKARGREEIKIRKFTENINNGTVTVARDILNKLLPLLN